MGISFRKKVKLGKNLHLNISKSGVSMSAKVGNTTINSNGKVTTKLGNGIIHTTNLKKLKNKK